MKALGYDGNCDHQQKPRASSTNLAILSSALGTPVFQTPSGPMSTSSRRTKFLSSLRPPAHVIVPRRDLTPGEVPLVLRVHGLSVCPCTDDGRSGGHSSSGPNVSKTPEVCDRFRECSASCACCGAYVGFVRLLSMQALRGECLASCPTSVA